MVAENARRLQEKRVAALLDMAARFDHAAQIRRFLAASMQALESDSGERRDEILEWCDWGEQIASGIDPLSDGVEGLALGDSPPSPSGS